MDVKHIGIIIMAAGMFFFSSAAMATPPATPSNLAGRINSSSVSITITVTWTAPPDSDLSGYATSWANSSDTLPWEKNRTASATSATSASRPDGSWYFVIRAIKAVNNNVEYSELAYAGPFTINTTPGMFEISPNTGKNDSTTVVTITGTGFMDNASVKIGTTAMTSVDVKNATELTATVPPGLTAKEYDITVSNPSGKSRTKTNAFTVISGNSTPVVKAGSEKTVKSGNAQSFSDATATDADEDDMTYTWSVDSAPEGAIADTDYTLASEKSLKGVTFTPTKPGVYSLKLTATDSNGAKGSDTVRVTVNTDDNTTPSVNAGTDQFVVSGDDVNLKGTVTDLDAGDEWIYEWTLSAPSGSSISSLTDDDTTEPSFTPDITGVYSVSFVATDKAGVASAADTVTITVYIPGDMDADGEITLSDVIMAMKVLVGTDVTGIQTIAIATGDKIGLAEVVYILKALL